MLGYSYPAGYFDDPKNRRNRCSLLLEGPEGNVLIDCPPESRLQLTARNVMDLSAVIITHTHADHVMGMDDLRSICILKDKSMPIYTLIQHALDIQRVFPYAFNEAPPGLFYPRFELHEFLTPEILGGLNIVPFQVEHGNTTVIGIRTGDFAYITDVSAIPDAASSLLYDLKTLVIDGLQEKPHPNHFSKSQAIEFGKSHRAERIILTHLNHFYDHTKDSLGLPPGVEFAYDGLEIEFSLN